jgi:polyisoprenoid-binding protein YceI
MPQYLTAQPQSAKIVALSSIIEKRSLMSATSIPVDRIPAGTYSVDPSHSAVGFEVRHMGIATVRGAFRRFQGTVDATGTPVLTGSVEVASVDTGDEQRDAHLTAPDFFDVEQYPEIKFNTTTIESGDDGKLRLIGEITIRGVAKPLELIGTAGEGGADPWGNERIGFEVEGVIDRREFGLNWNQVLPNGNLLVSNEVKLVISVSAVKAAS